MIKLEKDTYIEPVFIENVVPVCFSANNAYIPQTAVMINSIVINASDSKNYDLIILSTDIDAVNEKNVINLGKGKNNVSIRIFDITDLIDDVQFFTDSVYTPTTYSKEAYFRLFIPFAMPDYDKVIYFDGDMTAATDVSPLMDIDMTEYMGAATRDYCGIAACYDPGSDRKAYRMEIGIKSLDDYFISSMVILNINRFRDAYTLEFVKELISSRNWRQHDQDILNILCQDALLIVDAKWSYFEEFDYSLQYLPENMKTELFDAQKAPCVIHYAGSNKAWVDDKSPMTVYFWQNAGQTPYFEEFYKKISNNKVCYRYHVINDITGKKLDYYYVNGDIVLSSTPLYIGKLSDLKVCVEFMRIKNNKLYIDGYFETIDMLGVLKIYATLNGVGVPVFNSEEYREYGNVKSVQKARNFSVCLQLDMSKENNMIEFGLTYDDRNFIFPSYVSVEQFAPINEYGYCFYSSEGFVITKQEGVRFEVAKHSRRKILSLNNKICKFLRAKNEKYFSKMARVRWLYYFSKPFMRNKNIWLVSGTENGIDNNIIEFFKFLKTRKGVDPYLIVGEKDERFDELRKLGKTLRVRSKKHKFYFLHAKTIIAAEYNNAFFMPVYVRANEVRDMVANKKMIYWHDGKEDLAYNIKPWYNIHRFILFDNETYEFMIDYKNGYSEDNFVMVNNLLNTSDYYDLFNRIDEDDI